MLCSHCKKEFQTKPSWIRYGRKYCSEPCQRLGMRKGKNVKCSWCEKVVYKSLKELHGTKSGKLFCSKTCSLAWIASEHQEENHPNWKNGEKSYRHILERHTKKKICILCQTENPDVMAVHHVDQNRKNNKLSNLQWLCHNCHHLVHCYPREKIRFTKLLTPTNATPL